MLHKARLVSDDAYAAKDAEGKARTRGAKKRKMVAVAPVYLRRRVERGEELPAVEIRSEVREERAVDVEREVRDERKRKLSLFKRIIRWFRHAEDDKDEMGAYDEDEMRADVLEFVAAGGKLPKAVFIELMEYLLPTWDDARGA